MHCIYVSFTLIYMKLNEHGLSIVLKKCIDHTSMEIYAFGGMKK